MTPPHLCPSWQKLRGPRSLGQTPKQFQRPTCGRNRPSAGLPGCHVFPSRGVELRAKEVSCSLGWTFGLARCGQIGNRLRERRLR